MTGREKEIIREHIKKELSALERSVTTLTDLLDGEVQSDANDWFTTKESNPSSEINEMALQKARQRIITLNNILEKIDNDSFGVCINCGKPIPVERLKALPTATRCISCK